MRPGLCACMYVRKQTQCLPEGAAQTPPAGVFQKELRNRSPAGVFQKELPNRAGTANGAGELTNGAGLANMARVASRSSLAVSSPPWWPILPNSHVRLYANKYSGYACSASTASTTRTTCIASTASTTSTASTASTTRTAAGRCKTMCGGGNAHTVADS